MSELLADTLVCHDFIVRRSHQQDGEEEPTRVLHQERGLMHGWRAESSRLTAPWCNISCAFFNNNTFFFSIIYHCRQDYFIFPFVDGDRHAEWKWIWKLITAHKHLPMLIQARQECAKDLMLLICVTTQRDFFYICWSTQNPAVSWHQDVHTLGGKKCWHSVQGFLQLIKVHHLCQRTGWTCWLQHRSEQPNIPPIPQNIKTHETFFFNFISPCVELAVPLKPLFNLTCFSRLDVTECKSPECLMHL